VERKKTGEKKSKFSLNEGEARRGRGIKNGEDVREPNHLPKERRLEKSMSLAQPNREIGKKL